MALPTSGPISLDLIAAEFGGAAPYSMDNYYRGGGLVPNITANSKIPLLTNPKTAISFDDFYGAVNQSNLTGIQSLAACYSAQGGFSVDLYQGKQTLTLGVWPTDPPNCQTCDWHWLQFGGTVDGGNTARAAANLKPYWTQVWTVDIDAIAVGSTINTRAPGWPYTLVSYTYQITRTGAKSINIVPYPSPWSTGDTGTTITIENWWVRVQALGGGSTDLFSITPINYVAGNIGLSW